MINEPVIVNIPVKMESFLGCSGKMLKPSTDLVKGIVEKIRKGKLITLEQLREKLASDFNVKTACPASTAKALQLLSTEENPVCFWRVVKKKGGLIAKFPNGVEGHASLLQKEGFEIDFSKNKPVVIAYATKLLKFA